MLVSERVTIPITISIPFFFGCSFLDSRLDATSSILRVMLYKRPGFTGLSNVCHGGICVVSMRSTVLGNGIPAFKMEWADMFSIFFSPSQRIRTDYRDCKIKRPKSGLRLSMLANLFKTKIHLEWHFARRCVEKSANLNFLWRSAHMLGRRNIHPEVKDFAVSLLLLWIALDTQKNIQKHADTDTHVFFLLEFSQHSCRTTWLFRAATGWHIFIILFVSCEGPQPNSDTPVSRASSVSRRVILIQRTYKKHMTHVTVLCKIVGITPKKNHAERED